MTAALERTPWPRRRLRPVAAGGLALVVLAPGLAMANAAGIVGHSGRTPATCNSCHAGGSAPTVALEGPLEMAPGAVATFRFRVTSAAPATQRAAGFNVAASAGILEIVTGQGARKQSGELTHQSRKSNDGAGVATWDFTWQAPSTGGDHTLFAAGNSVNANGLNTGDRAATTVLVVRVVAATETPMSPETPVPTATSGPPTPTDPPAATATPEPSSTRRETPTGTPTRTATPSATPTPTPTGPSPGDANCDARINAADVLAVLLEIQGEGAGCEFADADCDGAVDPDDLDAVIARAFGAARADLCAAP